MDGLPATTLDGLPSIMVVGGPSNLMATGSPPHVVATGSPTHVVAESPPHVVAESPPHVVGESPPHVVALTNHTISQETQRNYQTNISIRQETQRNYQTNISLFKQAIIDFKSIIASDSSNTQTDFDIVFLDAFPDVAANDQLKYNKELFERESIAVCPVNTSQQNEELDKTVTAQHHLSIDPLEICSDNDVVCYQAIR